MTSRRLFLGTAAVAALAAYALPFRPVTESVAKDETPGGFKVVNSDDEWRRILTRDQYAVLRQEGTGRAHTSPLLHEKRKGVFA